jgi:hypothetical protein
MYATVPINAPGLVTSTSSEGRNVSAADSAAVRAACGIGFATPKSRIFASPNYVIFARVTAGMDAVDALASTPTTIGADGGMSQPLTPPIITEDHDSSVARVRAADVRLTESEDFARAAERSLTSLQPSAAGGIMSRRG